MQIRINKMSFVKIFDNVPDGLVVVDFVKRNNSERLHYELLLHFQLDHIFDGHVEEGEEDHYGLEGYHAEHHQRLAVQVL
jgi:hypothetical protein